MLYESLKPASYRQSILHAYSQLTIMSTASLQLITLARYFADPVLNDSTRLIPRQAKPV
jgi:hypothetical protein